MNVVSQSFVVCLFPAPTNTHLLTVCGGKSLVCGDSSMSIFCKDGNDSLCPSDCSRLVFCLERSRRLALKNCSGNNHGP